MQLYHYRSIDTALLEIGNGTFHYASVEELNDPVEMACQDADLPWVKIAGRKGRLHA
jgi:hypothetical protein